MVDRNKEVSIAAEIGLKMHNNVNHEVQSRQVIESIDDLNIPTPSDGHPILKNTTIVDDISGSSKTYHANNVSGSKKLGNNDDTFEAYSPYSTYSTYSTHCSSKPLPLLTSTPHQLPPIPTISPLRQNNGMDNNTHHLYESIFSPVASGSINLSPSDSIQPFQLHKQAVQVPSSMENNDQNHRYDYRLGILSTSHVSPRNANESSLLSSFQAATNPSKNKSQNQLPPPLLKCFSQENDDYCKALSTADVLVNELHSNDTQDICNQRNHNESTASPSQINHGNFQTLQNTSTHSGLSDNQHQLSPSSIPVFDHILLLPPSHHKATKEPALPSNYLTPEEEEAQACEEQLKLRRKRKRVIKPKVSTVNEVSDEKFEIGRNGRIRKKPKFYADFVTGGNSDDDDDDEADSDDDSFYDFDDDDNDDDNIFDHNGFEDNEYGEFTNEESFEEEDEISLSDYESTSASTSPKLSQKHHRGRKVTLVGVDYGTDDQSNACWNKRLESLKRFKAETGHTRVPQRVKSQNHNYRELSIWVKKVREKYKKVKKGISVPTLSPDHIKQLDEIGFVWVVRDTDHVVTFEEHLSELIQFKKENGHTRVPHVYEKNPKLGRWCHHIKLSYNKIKKGEKPMIKLNQAQIDKLNEIGFQWRIRFLASSSKNHYDTKNMKIDERIKQLKTYYNTNGHGNITHGEENDNGLACWVSTLKASYRQMQEGKRPLIKLKEAQIRELNELQFDWTEDVDNNRFDLNTGRLFWNDRYEQLSNFKASFGSCQVPCYYDDDQPFATWVHSQRYAMRNKSLGLESHLTDEQYSKLEQIGLEYNLYEWNEDGGPIAANQKHSFRKTKKKDFESCVNQLKQFHSEHGHFDEPRLKNFVHNLRCALKFEGFQKRSNIVLSPERVQMLQDIGFDSPSERKTYFYDSIVKKPTIGSKGNKLDSKSMMTWCKDLNLGFVFGSSRRCKKFGPSDIEEDEGDEISEDPMVMTPATQLTMTTWCHELGLGFCFETQQDFFESKLHSLWEFKAQNGHLNVPSMTDKSLHAWITNVKSSYKRIQVGKSPLIKLTKNRMRSLEAIGFDFNFTVKYTKKSQRHAGLEGKELDSKSMLTWCKDLNLGFVFDEVSRQKRNHRKRASTEAKALDSLSMLNWCKDLNIGFLFDEVPYKKQKYRKRGDTLLPTLNQESKSDDRGEKKQILPVTMTAWCHELDLGFNFENSQSDLFFESKLEALKEFKAQNGHLNVPSTTDKSLHAWITNVKSSYRRIQVGKSPLIKLTKNRMRSLEALGFDFNYQRSRNVMIDNCTNSAGENQFSSFECKLQELKKFKAKHGHINVTMKCNKTLCAWISNLRTSYKRVLKDEPPLIKLTEERMTSLEDIGFDFNRGANLCMKHEMNSKSLTSSSHCHMETNVSIMNWLQNLKLGFILTTSTTRTKDGNNYSKNCSEGHQGLFEAHLQKLREYKRRHGHIKVSEDEDKTLKSWIDNIRTSHRRIRSGKTPLIKLTEEKIATLVDIGFNFDTYTVKTKVEKHYNAFDAHAADLKAFIIKHGHMDIKSVIKYNKSLGNWCKNVRSSYHRILKGQANTGLRLSADKIEMLKDIGFDFSLNSPGKKRKIDQVSDCAHLGAKKHCIKKAKDDMDKSNRTIGNTEQLGTICVNKVDTYQVSIEDSASHESKRPFAKISSVQPSSPATNAGLRLHDLIIKIDSINADNHRNLQAVLEALDNAFKDGDLVEVVIDRLLPSVGKMKRISIKVKPGWEGEGLLGCTLVKI